MRPLLPNVYDQLVERANAQTHRRSRLRVAAATCGVVTFAVAGVAAAASLWTPQLGGRSGPTVSASADDVPPEQARDFAVLRRPQNDTDRSVDVSEALTYLPPTVEGVRVAGVRALGRTPEGQLVALIPVAKYGDVTDALCLWLQDAVDGGSFRCASTQEALSGDLSLVVVRTPSVAKASGVDHGTYSTRKVDKSGATSAVFGLVPDGVEVVASRSSGARARTEKGFFALSSTGIEGADQISWYDSHGQPIEK